MGAKVMEKRCIITIGREYGSKGRIIGEKFPFMTESF